MEGQVGLLDSNSDAVVFLVILLAWIVLMRVVLPRLGVKT